MSQSEDKTKPSSTTDPADERDKVVVGMGIQPSHWCIQYCRYVLAVLRLDYMWKVDICVVKDLKDESGNPSHGVCSSQHRYREAQISFDEDSVSQRDRESELLVIHECLHVMLSRCNATVHSLARSMQDHFSRLFVSEMWDEAEDSVVTDLAKVIHELTNDRLVRNEQDRNDNVSAWQTYKYKTDADWTRNKTSERDLS